MSLKDSIKEIRELREAEEDLEEAELKWMKMSYEMIEEFVDKVCKRAEEKMLVTLKLEGAHFASMMELLKEYKEKLDEI